MQEILFTIYLYKPDTDNSGKWRIDAITREVSWTRKKKDTIICFVSWGYGESPYDAYLVFEELIFLMSFFFWRWKKGTFD